MKEKLKWTGKMVLLLVLFGTVGFPAPIFAVSSVMTILVAALFSCTGIMNKASNHIFIER